MPNQPERFRDTSLPIIERVKDLLSRLTIEEKIHLLSTHQLPVERLGIGEWYVGQEVARGYVPRKDRAVYRVPAADRAGFYL